MAVTDDEKQEVRPIGGLIRKRRKALGMTLQALADSASVSVGYLSQVERDNAVPTLGTLAQIAGGLDVELEYFVASPRPADAITRAVERPTFSLAGSSIRYESLSNEYPGSELSSYLLTIPPGYASEIVSHAGDEFVYVLSGEIEHMLEGETFRLGPGDSFHFNGAKEHALANRGDDAAQVLWAGTLDVMHSRERRKIPRLVPANNNA
ncbi:helix-turn-helix domain-containing protein [Pelagovum pacificum]|uniref:Helix-turn-helix transcriptional regulator n=1 Tax=Pelagovum pacificum TaxID=2588711 RepID=A0A5C5G852_9RHOB|nr:XRE family transcriptional regulator [Pelagovum pacificum]QQA41609.1 cupin domain-containing protein [Pelagovum pacificum]TNY30889.1 helix-turn-helix transcriptional regulator [Pelagovum pacificum]